MYFRASGIVSAPVGALDVVAAVGVALADVTAAALALGVDVVFFGAVVVGSELEAPAQETSKTETETRRRIPSSDSMER